MEGADQIVASAFARSRKARVRLTADEAGRRTRQDWAHQIKKLVGEDFPAAKAIRLVCDNLTPTRWTRSSRPGPPRATGTSAA